MNRFEKTRRPSLKLLRLLGTLVTFFLLLFFFLSGVNSISKNAAQEEKTNLENAIRRSAVCCYAFEGAYPESLSYLMEHYGITYDSSRFLVDYEIIGSNLMPDIHVFSRKGGAS